MAFVLKARKLLAKDALQVIWLRYSVGVPLNRLKRDFDVDLSLPSFTRLVEFYQETTDQEQAVSVTDTIFDSLFPAWLNPELKTVQSQPKHWKYVGKFPVGKWLRIEYGNY